MYKVRSEHREFTLPPSRPGQAYASVSALAGGFITVPDWAFISPAHPDAKRKVPSLAFLVSHPGIEGPDPLGIFPTKRPILMMFDLGLRSSADNYLEVQQKHLEGRRPYKLEPGIAAQLTEGGVNPRDIDTVLLSHVHYDHHGDPENFPRAKFLVGSGALELLKHGLKGRASHQHFEPDLLPEDRTLELPHPDDPRWRILPPFRSALDIFGDGSVYVMDIPGHLPGHTTLLCHVAPDRWIGLCGDAFHDRQILTGEKEIGFWEGTDGEKLCIHLDPNTAMESIAKLRSLASMESVELIAAHDEGWLKEAERAGRMFPNNL